MACSLSFVVEEVVEKLQSWSTAGLGDTLSTCSHLNFAIL